ncbi:MAG: terpene cyclase/mutase family protein [Planctomycetes bacterium]|nr:terpene cyclase/mutase family protein [Planctomycetota bacterium]
MSCALLLASVVCITTKSVFAQPAAEVDPAVLEEVTASVDRSLAYLAKHQRADGSWDGNNAPNALAMLAFMGRGHIPGRGKYRDVLRKVKQYTLARQNDDGLFVPERNAGSGPMYQQALTTLAVAEMYGVDPDDDLEEALRDAVQLIVNSQSHNGGWRYQPRPGDSDLSVTVMQIVALRAANNAAIAVPEETIEDAVTYVRSCARQNGGFGYQGPSRTPPMSAAGVVSLQLLGHYDDPLLEPTLDYLSNVPVQWGNSGGVNWYYYFHYYAMQANYQAGGVYWDDWHPRVRKMLLREQHDDGSWSVPPGTSEGEGTVGVNRVYYTSMATLILEVYMHYLPAYQR